jgi:hypothetical protein
LNKPNGSKNLYDEGSHDYVFLARRVNDKDDSTVFANVYGLPKIEKKPLQSGVIDCSSGIVRAAKTLTLLYFVAPNGTRYELRDKNSQGSINNVNNCTSLAYNRGTVFTSVDGSAATFISDQPITDKLLLGDDSSFVNPTGYLNLPNGSTYRFEGGDFKWLRDKNGNIINSITSLQPDGTYASGLRDSINRELLFISSAPSTMPHIDTIKYKGFGGTDKNVYVHYDNLANALRADQSLKNTKQLFPQLLESSLAESFNPQVISKIVLADNVEYKLFYNSYGDIARLESPTGSSIEYDWKGALIGGPDEGVANGPRDQQEIIQRRVVERRTYLNNTDLAQKMVIGRLNNDPNTIITVDTLGTTSLINRVKYFYYGNPIPPLYNAQLYSFWKDGRNYETQIYGQDGTTLLSRELTAQENRPVSWLTPQDTEPANDARPTKKLL